MPSRTPAGGTGARVNSPMPKTDCINNNEGRWPVAIANLEQSEIVPALKHGREQ
jgi:hypothetical protein